MPETLRVVGDEDGQYAEWLGLALDQARVALTTDDVPVGAVIVDAEGLVIGVGPNRRVADADPLAHAEIVAIRAAAATLGHYRLDDCTIAVTLEPCLMCAGAIMQSRISHIVFGAWDPKAGACGSAWDVIAQNPSPHRVDAVGGIRQAECAQLLTDFFRARRG
ncbi:tRNA adenosine(34) deaminase TadA [Branchiibius sp. NY16-3462-2]|uniref:tRNA adenosine(34) deaminase TadA n=1 Tax=Branchiibius sp. NY16-3462-2 TaxID=1807500 RepID=UPI000798D9DF|nr:tRNA adenosine(34) deaminase TadA [Branchiibius sp. NY16-3462-2]KYH44945.1 tRNA-specific adenosine deaminase [Branchiibius sp. NY16-3462-2]